MNKFELNSKQKMRLVMLLEKDIPDFIKSDPIDILYKYVPKIIKVYHSHSKNLEIYKHNYSNYLSGNPPTKYFSSGIYHENLYKYISSSYNYRTTENFLFKGRGIKGGQTIGTLRWLNERRTHESPGFTEFCYNIIEQMYPHYGKK